MHLCVIIAAAGRSERFGPRDKLAEDLGGRPLLVRTVEAFTRLDEARTILVAGPPADTEAGAAFRERFAPTLGFHGATVVDGGRTARWETVAAALGHVPEEATHVAVHDAARPAASHELLGRVLAAARERDAVVPAVPVAGTLKRAEDATTDLTGGDDADRLADAILGGEGRERIDGRRVLETVDRAGLWEVQTPQVFAAPLLRRACAEVDPAGATDDAMLVERLGADVWLVPGERTNLKVTEPADLELVRAILAARGPGGAAAATGDPFGFAD